MTTALGRFAAYLTALLLLGGVLGVVSAPSASAGFVDRDCGDFRNQAAAQKFYINAGGPKRDPHRLDGDRDGKACDSLPCPCSSAKGSSGGTKAATLRQRAKVVRVVDGDTVDVRLGSGAKRRVRMLGINTPEMKPRQCGAVPATRSARKMLPRGARVVLVSDPTQARKDRYGRLLRYVMKGKVDISQRQVARGWARVYVVGKPFKRVAKYRHAQTVAKRKHRGIWGRC